MHCPECGAKISPENARFCYQCGQKLFFVSIENEKKASETTSDSNQTSIAGNVKTGGGDFVGRDFHDGKSFVFHLAQPGVYKVILSATLSVLFVFLIARTLLLVYQINGISQPGGITVHPGVLTTATAAAQLATAVSREATATAGAAQSTATIDARATLNVGLATTDARAAAEATSVRATIDAQAEVQATVAIELTLGAEARATLAVLQTPTGTSPLTQDQLSTETPPMILVATATTTPEPTLTEMPALTPDPSQSQ